MSSTSSHPFQRRIRLARMVLTHRDRLLKRPGAGGNLRITVIGRPLFAIHDFAKHLQGIRWAWCTDVDWAREKSCLDQFVDGFAMAMLIVFTSTQQNE